MQRRRSRSFADDQNASMKERAVWISRATVASDRLSGGLRNLFAIAGISVGTMQTLVNTINGLNSAAAGIVGQRKPPGSYNSAWDVPSQQCTAVTRRINFESDLAFMVQAGMITQMETDQLQKYDLTVNNHNRTLRPRRAICDVGQMTTITQSR